MILGDSEGAEGDLVPVARKGTGTVDLGFASEAQDLPTGFRIQKLARGRFADDKDAPTVGREPGSMQRKGGQVPSEDREAGIRLGDLNLLVARIDREETGSVRVEIEAALGGFVRLGLCLWVTLFRALTTDAFLGRQHGLDPPPRAPSTRREGRSAWKALVWRLGCSFPWGGVVL